MENLELLHKTNIVIHVSTGLIALMLGLTALSALKDGKIQAETGFAKNAEHFIWFEKINPDLEIKITPSKNMAFGKPSKGTEVTTA